MTSSRLCCYLNLLNHLREREREKEAAFAGVTTKHTEISRLKITSSHGAASDVGYFLVKLPCAASDVAVVGLD